MRVAPILVLALLAPSVAAVGAPACEPYDAGGIVTVTCEERDVGNGNTQRATQVQVTADHDAPIAPSFFARVRFSEVDGENGTFSRCSVYYHRLGGPGPQSVEWGVGCPYVFS